MDFFKVYFIDNKFIFAFLYVKTVFLAIDDRKHRSLAQRQYLTIPQSKRWFLPFFKQSVNAGIKFNSNTTQ